MGARGGWGLAPIFSPLGEKVRRWGKMCLEKGVFGGWGAGAGGCGATALGAGECGEGAGGLDLRADRI